MHVFLFQPILCSDTFNDAPLYLNAHARMYMCHVCRCARIMQIHIQMIAEVKAFQRLNMLNVNHMHTLVYRVFKWNYEQLLYGQAFLPTDFRFARAMHL